MEKRDRPSSIHPRNSPETQFFRSLLELQAENAAIEATGQAMAEARAKAEVSRIQGELAVNLSPQEVEAARIRAEAELEQLRARQEAELAHQQALINLEIEKGSMSTRVGWVEVRNPTLARLLGFTYVQPNLHRRANCLR